jgi:biopolymer transport protein ExbD
MRPSARSTLVSAVLVLCAWLPGCGNKPAGDATAAPAAAEPAPADDVQAHDVQADDVQADAPSGDAAPVALARPIIVEVDSRGQAVVDGTPAGDADLDRIFRGAFERDRDTKVILRIDPAASHGRAVEILDRARAAGLTRVAIATEAAP